MAYALVGTIGAVSTGSLSASVTPAWGTNENRNANNLLVAFVFQSSGTVLTATPSGWTKAVSAGTKLFPAIFYKVAAGSDSAPTFAGVTGATINAQLAEFSGNTASPQDQTGSGNGATSPLTVTLAAADATVGELLLGASYLSYTSSNTGNCTFTSNNATFTAAGSNNGSSSTTHWAFGYATGTTSNSGADTVVSTASVTTNISTLQGVGASFKVSPSPVGMTLSVNQAIKRASFF